MEFRFLSPIVIVDETVIEGKPMMVEVTLLSEGVTGNGRLYTFEDLQKIADQCLGKPVFYGVDPVTNEHTNELRGYDPDQHPKVGEVCKVWIDETTRKIKAHLKITKEEIKSIIRTLGISVGGFATKIKNVLFGGKRVWHIINSMVDHIQLVPSTAIRGDPNAKVDNIVDETIIFPMLTKVDKAIFDNLNLQLKNIPPDMIIEIEISE
jgi:hypothetical protein